MNSGNRFHRLQVIVCAVALTAGGALRLLGKGKIAEWIRLGGASLVLLSVLADILIAM